MHGQLLHVCRVAVQTHLDAILAPFIIIISTLPSGVTVLDEAINWKSSALLESTHFTALPWCVPSAVRSVGVPHDIHSPDDPKSLWHNVSAKCW